MLGGRCGLVFLLLLTSSAISHLPFPCTEAAGLSELEQRLGPVLLCLETRSCRSSSFELPKKGTKPAKISHCIKLHSDGNEIVVLSFKYLPPGF